MLSRKNINTLLMSAVALTLGSAAAIAQTQSHDAPPEKEKCYGVSKATLNDCASVSGSHSCAGNAAVDGSGEEWVAVPKGLCNKLVGGSMTPVSANAAPPVMPAPQVVPAPGVPATTP